MVYFYLKFTLNSHYCGEVESILKCSIFFKKRLLTVFTSMFIMLTLISIILLIYFINDLMPFINISKPNTGEENIQVYDYLNNHTYTIKDSNLIDAPLILQYPELPRGCEVTSLTMLLQYAGVQVDKLTLAEEIEKDNSYYTTAYGRIYYGNPDSGFVGNMYSLNEPGLGVYHKPIYNLLNEYLPNQAIDLTGRVFDDILYFISNDTPVWVITNTKFKELSPDNFQVWYTSTGPIQITYLEHSVLLTGYDENYIYFNDPLINVKNIKVPIDNFKKSWEQMGSQAVTYIPTDKHELFTFLP